MTVPHILQIMLLSPSNARSWSPKVRRIIFDEIHCIGQAEDGVVWEQLLLLAPCPIIALSATVGNPSEFGSWLRATQESLGHQLITITHEHRHSDLRKFIYRPPEKFLFLGLAEMNSLAKLGLDELQGFHFLHPIASLSNRSRGLPDDLGLEARDCLTLWKAMCEAQTEHFPVPPALDPYRGTYLKNTCLRKADVIEWELALKEKLQSWMADARSPFDQVIQLLSPSIDGASKCGHQASCTTSARKYQDEDFKEVKAEDLRETTLPLLCKLHEGCTASDPFQL